MEKPMAGKRTGSPGIIQSLAASHPVAFYWLPAVIYAAGMFTLSSMSKPPAPPGTGGLQDFSEIVHFTEYAIFGVLLSVAFSSLGGEYFRRRAAVFALAAACLYGLGDEAHQSFVPGRTASLGDFTIDCVGAASGIALAALYRFWAAGESRKALKP